MTKKEKKEKIKRILAKAEPGRCLNCDIPIHKRFIRCEDCEKIFKFKLNNL